MTGGFSVAVRVLGPEGEVLRRVVSVESFTLVGSAPFADVCVPLASVAPLHLVLLRHEGRLLVKARDGLLTVDGVATDNHPVSGTARIGLGEATLELVDLADAAPAADATSTQANAAVASSPEPEAEPAVEDGALGANPFGADADEDDWLADDGPTMAVPAPGPRSAPASAPVTSAPPAAIPSARISMVLPQRSAPPAAIPSARRPASVHARPPPADEDGPTQAVVPVSAAQIPESLPMPSVISVAAPVGRASLNMVPRSAAPPADSAGLVPLRPAAPAERPSLGSVQPVVPVVPLAPATPLDRASLAAVEPMVPLDASASSGGAGASGVRPAVAVAARAVPVAAARPVAVARPVAATPSPGAMAQDPETTTNTGETAATGPTGHSALLSDVSGLFSALVDRLSDDQIPAETGVPVAPPTAPDLPPVPLPDAAETSGQVHHLGTPDDAGGSPEHTVQAAPVAARRSWAEADPWRPGARVPASSPSLNMEGSGVGAWRPAASTPGVAVRGRADGPVVDVWAPSPETPSGPASRVAGRAFAEGRVERDTGPTRTGASGIDPTATGPTAAAADLSVFDAPADLEAPDGATRRFGRGGIEGMPDRFMLCLAVAFAVHIGVPFLEPPPPEQATFEQLPERWVAPVRLAPEVRAQREIAATAQREEPVLDRVAEVQARPRVKPKPVAVPTSAAPAAPTSAPVAEERGTTEKPRPRVRGDTRERLVNMAPAGLGGVQGGPAGGKLGGGGLGKLGLGPGPGAGGGLGGPGAGLGAGLGGPGTGPGKGAGWGRSFGPGVTPVARAGKRGGSPAKYQQTLRQTIQRRFYSDVKACYDRALRTDDRLRGRLVAKFTVRGDGSLGPIQFSFEPDPEGAGDPQRFLACVRAMPLGEKFPKPPDGGEVDISYPFRLKPVE